MQSSKTHALQYLSVLTLPLTVVLAFSLRGIWSFLPLVYAFGLIPLFELLVRPQATNLDAAEEALARQDPWYDWVIYLMVPVQVFFVGYFLLTLQQQSLTLAETIGLIFALGLMCGVFGINIGHELGHRVQAHERILAKIALLTSLYMHFYIEHNRGHHKRVATEADPASARFGEHIYHFWGRSIVYSYLSAWELEEKRLAKKQHSWFSWQNEMLRFHLIQLLWLAAIGVFFGPLILLCYLGAALIGILLLETVNYIEHYGLQRTATREGRYQQVRPEHSWNSNHVLGRLMLFELSRHSDHHYQASRKYQILRHHEMAPQMPTGYPGMMVLALVPPLWFRVMHPQLSALQEASPGQG